MGQYILLEDIFMGRYVLQKDITLGGHILLEFKSYWIIYLMGGYVLQEDMNGLSARQHILLEDIFYW